MRLLSIAAFAATSHAQNPPVNGNWGEWRDSGPCQSISDPSVPPTCGGSGLKQRYRNCDNPGPTSGGQMCRDTYGNTAVMENGMASCVGDCPPVNGNWGEWSDFGECKSLSDPLVPADCEVSGVKERTRSCNNPAPTSGGSDCTDSNGIVALIENESADCMEDCPTVNGNWGAWSDFGECKSTSDPLVNATCEDHGIKERTRACNNPAPSGGGQECKNKDGVQSLTEAVTSPCSGYCPPVNGNWGQWSDFGECKDALQLYTVGCNVDGDEQRTRQCDSPAPAHGGLPCGKFTVDEENASCKGFCPPVDGGFSDWSSWDACSLTCGGGSKGRSRTCTNPAPLYDGAVCRGPTSETENCNTQACPVDGGFSDWSSWDACSLTCGGGSKGKSRTCTNPAPLHGGAVCRGPTSETENCNTQACPGISAVCNDDNTISVKIDYDRAGSILSASYGTCNASDMTGADASNVKTWDVTLNPSRCDMETKLRTLNYTQTAKFTVGRKDGNTQMKFATFEVDSYCSYTSEYTVSFSYGPLSADSFDFTESGGLLGLHFHIASYENASYVQKADPSNRAGNTIYLKLALNATENADFDHATSMDASSGKVFVPTKCAVTDSHSNEYSLFDTSSSDTCANDIIDLKITYNEGDGQSWYIAHTLFLLNNKNTSNFAMSCNILVCDAAQVTECKTAYNCLTEEEGT